MKVGFARVSTDKQDLKQQLDALNAVPCNKVFHLKASGTSQENDEKLAELIDYIRDDDVVYVTKLNRLARSTNKILASIEAIHEKNARLVTLDGSIDTSNDNPFSKAMISIIATFAELDKDLIKQRTSEGQAAAKAAGKRLGKPPSLDQKQTKQVVKLLKADESVINIAKKFSVSRQVIYRIKEKHITK
ncbi:recombinase family protein [Thalassotalea eurytherma]|uniref:Resolvase n=1 Tax=Thalassotalea eurytherma TaxID=1144278 RepID=A0ABQ6H0Y0_9GAMM|nr:recombinase family protein [Thalassotalea eurytherma]GLX81858.1 resolvase [Thalassotalea eurytherma]